MRNKGGRPRKTEGAKTKQIHIRVSEQHHLVLKALETDSGLHRSELFVRRVLENQTYLITSEVLTTLQSLGLELSRIGNNLNQLAYQANSARLQGKVFLGDPEAVGRADFAAYRDLQLELIKLFRLMYRTMKEK